MKKTILLIIFICTSIFANFDRSAYNNYKTTNQYQIASAKQTGTLFTHMHATSHHKENKLYWGLILKKIEDLTGDWADLGAIAKGNHENFVYITLTPVLEDSHGHEIYRCTTIYTKVIFGQQSQINYKSIIAPNLNTKHVTLVVGLITDNSTLQTPKEKKKKKLKKK